MSLFVILLDRTVVAGIEWQYWSHIANYVRLFHKSLYSVNLSVLTYIEYGTLTFLVKNVIFLVYILIQICCKLKS